MTIIRESAELNRVITKAIAARATYRDLLHTAVSSAIWHAAEHGDPSYLNRIYPAMESNDQAALRMQIGLVHLFFGLNLEFGKELPEVMEPEERKAALRLGAILEVNQGKWRVLNKMDKPNAPELRKKLASFAVEVIDKGEHKNFKRFYEVDNIRTKTYFEDTQVIRRVIATFNAANRKSTDSRVVNVSPKLKGILEKFKDTLESFANNIEHDEPTAPRPAAAKGRGKRRARGEKSEAREVSVQ